MVSKGGNEDKAFGFDELSLLERALSDKLRKRYGFNILFGTSKKRPLIQKWQEWCGAEEQTDEIIRAIYEPHKDKFVNYGYAAGSNGLTEIDIDWVWVYPLAKKEFGERLNTFTVETVNGGGRFLFTTSNPRNVDKYKDTLHTEIHGKQYVACYGKAERYDGTIGEYKVVNDVDVTKDDLIIEDFVKFLEELEERYDFLTYPCLKASLPNKKGHLTHEQRLAIANLMVHKGIEEDEGKMFFAICTDYDEETSRYQYSYTAEKVKNGELKPPTCDRLRECFNWNDEKCKSCPRRKEEKKGKRKARKEEKEKVEEKKEYSEEIKQKAWTLVNNPAFFFDFGEDLRKGMFMPGIKKVRYVLGEEETKRHLAVNIAAAMMDQDTINFVFGGYATVKDTMVKMIFQLTGARYVRRGYLTAAGFRYSKEDVDVLYLPEADLSGEKGRQMRFMRSDDGGFEFEYAYKSKETGLMETETQKVGIRTIVITTNDVTFDGALESGGWLFQTDDSHELTEKVIPEKLRDYAEKREILSEEEIEVWNSSFDILTRSDDIPDFVRIPYALNLLTLFDLKRSESRRSPEKVCELIQKIAILRRYQKPPEYRDAADIVDLFVAMRIGKAAISETVSELTVKEHDVYDIVKKLESKNKAEYIQADLEDRGKISDGVTVKQISMELPFPSDTCYRLAKSITDKGYFAKSKRGKENEYFIKSELTNPSEIGITRMQSLKEPKDILEECIRLVYGKSDLGISDKGEEGGTKIVDPITGKELYLRGFSEITEIKNGKTKASEGLKNKKEEDKDGIRDKPRLLGEKYGVESLKTLIRSFVTNVSNQDERGAMILSSVNRIAKDQGLEKGEVKAAIDRMIQEGELEIAQEDHGEFVKFPGS